MLFQINHPDGDSLGLLDVETTFTTIEMGFSSKLTTMAEQAWVDIDDKGDIIGSLIENLAALGIKSSRVFVEEINI